VAASVGSADLRSEEAEIPTAPPRGSGTVLQGGLRTAWLVGVVVIGAQFVLLVLHSWYLWDHFDLTADFGAYSQAWQQIATGHLNPYDTTYAWYYPHYGYPFYQSDLELIMWPLALLYWVWPHAIDLLIVQDVALAGAGAVAFRWALEHLQLHAPSRRFALAVGGCVLAIVVLQPWTYWAASYDYHSEPLATFFALLAGRDLWAGRRRGWVWVVLVLLCGNVATSYVAGLGVAAIVSGRRRWRTGLVLLVVGVAWLGVVGLVHSGKGAALSAYAYLADRTTVNDTLGGIVTILAGVVAHPSIAGRMLVTRWGQIYKFVAGAGTIGFFSAVGAVLATVVLLPSALNSSPGFISDVGGSQNAMAVMACVVGIPMLATWLARRGRGNHRRASLGWSAVALVLVVGAVVQTAVMSAEWTPRSGQTFERVSSATAAELAAVSARIPEQAETIVSQGVVGRFAQRHVFYPYFDTFANGQTVPLYGRTVYVVLVPTEGLESAPASGTRAAVGLMRKLGARSIGDRDGVYAFAWRVPEGRHSITFPP
jgi:Predicted membrane protein (DUF2079)